MEFNYRYVRYFFRLREHIVEVLNELNVNNLLDNVNFLLLNDLKNALKPIRLTIEALSRADAILVSADLAINFMKNKLRESKAEISIKLLNNITKRIEERVVDPTLINLLKCLKDTNAVIPNKQTLTLASDIMKMLFDETNINNDQENILFDEDVEEIQELTMEAELNMILKGAMKEPEEKQNFNKLKQEFDIFKNTGKRTENLQRLYNAICTIKPTSTDSERAFSMSAYFCTKIRSWLSDDSLHSKK